MWSCLYLGLSMWSSSWWLIVQSHKYKHVCSFVYLLEHVLSNLNDNVDEECEYFSNSKSSASGCCLVFAWFFANFSLALLMKVLLIKKASIGLFLKVLCKLIYEAHWFSCLLIWRDQRKIIIHDKTTSTTQHHAVSMAPKNWKLRECAGPLKLSVFQRRIIPKLKKLKGFFSRITITSKEILILKKRFF